MSRHQDETIQGAAKAGGRGPLTRHACLHRRPLACRCLSSSSRAAHEVPPLPQRESIRDRRRQLLSQPRPWDRPSAIGRTGTGGRHLGQCRRGAPPGAGLLQGALRRRTGGGLPADTLCSSLHARRHVLPHVSVASSSSCDPSAGRHQAHFNPRAPQVWLTGPQREHPGRACASRRGGEARVAPPGAGSWRHGR